MMHRKYLLITAVAVVGLAINGCKPKATPEEYNKKAADTELYHASVEKLTEVIIHDIFKPPVASRIYAYATIAGYEALRPGHPEYQSLSGKLNGFGAVPAPEAGAAYCFPLAGTRALLNVARALTFSTNFYDDYEKEFYTKYKKMGVPDEVFERSMAYGDSVAAHVLKYASKDNYKQIRGFRYTVTNEPGKWVPTPPAYADACEPLWNTMRTFTLDSAAQFMPPRPPAYSKDPNSMFRREVKEVYEIGKNLTEEQKRIAYFWDDNAFVLNVAGHVSFANKKMTPGGHWLAISATVCRQKKAMLIQTAESYALTSIALFDAFVSCWDEKYRSAKVRPETVINSDLDPEWKPFLQTPPFPEYTSGHSTITAAAATVLQTLHGEMAFVDSTEHKYGHGVMSFKSFKEAAAMASISRVYGGIHFRSGCDEGAKMGNKVGQHVLRIAQTKPRNLAVVEQQ
jgi:PAP2 superfamily